MPDNTPRTSIDLFPQKLFAGANNATLHIAQETQEMLYRLTALQLGLHGSNSLLQGQATAIKNAEGLFQLAAMLCRHACTGQTHAVQAGNKGRVTGNNHEGWDILAHASHAANHNIATNLAELMHCGQTTDYSPVLHNNMSGQGSYVGHNNIIAHDAVMSHMGVGHHQNIVTNASLIALATSTVDSAALTEGAAITDNGSGFFANKLQILGRSTNGCDVKR